MAAPTITTDRLATARRRRELKAYMTRNVLDGKAFVCGHGSVCKASVSKPGIAFYEGQLSYVGRHYETQINGREFRVLIVAMEAGHPPAHVSLEQREEQVRAVIDGPRNPHMRGVLLALAAAFALPTTPNSTTEWLRTSEGDVHILDAYAMANLLLCSAVKQGTKKSKASGIMRSNCAEHLAATIRILEPSLVVSQGGSIEPELSRLFALGEQPHAHVWRASVGDTAFIWTPFSHPSSWDKPGQPPSRWESPTRPYFRDVVAPAIDRGRQLALRGSR